MSKARLVITAVVIEGRSQSEVARIYGVCQSWISRLVARYQSEGEAAFSPRSRRPHTSPTRLSQTTIDHGHGCPSGAHEVDHICLDESTAPPILWRLLATFVQPDRESREHLLTQLDDLGCYECSRCQRALLSLALLSMAGSAITANGGRDKAIVALENYLLQAADVSSVDDDLQGMGNDLGWITDF